MRQFIAVFALVMLVITMGILPHLERAVETPKAEAAYGDSQGDIDFAAMFGHQLDLTLLKAMLDTGVTATEFDILDGLTSTADELNHLDGILSTVSELNALYGSGLSNTELAVLDGAGITNTELSALAGAAVNGTEYGYINGLTSDAQTQLDARKLEWTINDQLTNATAATGNLYHNYSKAASLVMNLPAATGSGAYVAFAVTNGNALVLDPNGTDQILGLTNATGDGVTNGTAGAFLQLFDVMTGKWVVESYNDSWYDSN